MSSLKRVILFLFVCTGMALAEPPVATLVPEEDPAVPVGKIAIVEGRAGKTAQRLMVDGLDVDQAVQVTLVSKQKGSKLQLRVARENWDRVLRDQTMGKDSDSITFRFRASKHAAFLVSAPEETDYQLMVWVGPKMEWKPQAQVTSMAEFEGKKSETGVEGPSEKTTQESPQETPNSESENRTLIFALFFTNGLALSALGLFVWKNRKAAPLLVALVVGTSFMSTPVRAETKEPKPITVKQSWDRMRATVDQMVQLTGASTGNGTADDALSKANTALLLAQALFNYLDPKEAAVSPNYTPEGLPTLPSRSMDMRRVPSDVDGAQSELQECLRLLEIARGHYMTAILQAKAYEQAADAASSLSPLAGLYRVAQKSDPNYMAGKNGLDKIYDEAFTKLMTKANNALLTIAASERRQFGDFEWYARYGLPYYLFLNNRYQRKH